MPTRPYEEARREALKEPRVAIEYLRSSWRESIKAQYHDIFLSALRNVAEAHGIIPVTGASSDD